MTAFAPTASERLAAHRLDDISFGKIVQIREVLLRAQAKGARVIRFESGDPSFPVAPHVLDAIAAAGKAGKTH
jgi:aspartate aminotransferase